MVETEDQVARVLAGRVRSLLESVPSVLEDLLVAKKRLDRVARPVGRSTSGETPPPLRVFAMDRIDEIGVQLRGLMVVLDRDLGRPHRFRSDFGEMARELALHAGWLAEQPAAEEYLDQLRAAVKAGLREVDLPPVDSWTLLGPCGGTLADGSPCREDIYSDGGDDGYVACWRCGNTVSIQGRRNRLIAEAGDLVERPRVIVRMLKSQGIDISVKRIEGWTSRVRKKTGRPALLPSGTDAEGAKVYRVGDVYALCLEMQARRRTG